MSLAKKYDNRLRKKLALRAVWLPGTYVNVGDILRVRHGAFESVGNLKDYDIEFSSSTIAKNQSINLQAQGVSYTVLQNKAKVSVGSLAADVNAELNISFNKENSYFIRTPKLGGKGLDRALQISQKVAKISSWDSNKNFIVHKVWLADDFVFLGSIEKGTSVKFAGKGDAIKDLLDNGISANISTKGQTKISFKVLGQAGPIVMQVFRVRLNGEYF